MDYTALVASVQQIRDSWVPAKVEQVSLLSALAETHVSQHRLLEHLTLSLALQVVQSDKQTLCMRIRTLEASTWLHLCWHPVSGRICTGPSPQRGAAAEAFSFGKLVSTQPGLGRNLRSACIAIVRARLTGLSLIPYLLP